MNTQSKSRLLSIAALLIAGPVYAPAIQNGTTDADNPRNNAVVRFSIGGNDGICTGTLISNTLVVTAGHCVGARSLPVPAPHPPFNTTYGGPGSDWQFPGGMYALDNTALGGFDVLFGADRSGMTANADRIGPWETYQIVDVNGGSLLSGESVRLRTSQACYLCAEDGGGTFVTSNRTVAATWETFRMRRVGGGFRANFQDGDAISLQADNGKYVTAEGGGGGTVNANRAGVDVWEQFRLHKVGGSAGADIRGGDSIALQASNGQYVVAELGGLCTGRIRADAYSLPGFADIIMLRLSRPVPVEIAQPARVLTAPPAYRGVADYWHLQTFDMVGWGPMAETGPTPRYRQRARSNHGQTPCAPYGVPTPTYLCVEDLSDARLVPGDSGSPLFWTNPTSGLQYLIGVAQGDQRYTPTFSRGGSDGAGNRTADIGLWIEQALRQENCRTVDTPLSVRRESDGDWTIYQYGFGPLRNFGRDEAAARDTLRAIQSYGATSYCWVDSPGPEHEPPAMMEYWLRSGGRVYGTPPSGESCTSFPPGSLVVRFAGGGRWEIAQPTATRPIVAFGSDPLVDYLRATDSLQIIRANGFGKACSAGTSATYFK